MSRKHSDTARGDGGGMIPRRVAWLIIVLAFLSPLGLLAKGTAFGEWSAAGLKKAFGYAPKGMVKLESFWRWAPLAGYGVQGRQGELMRSMAYILSTAIGVVAILAIFKCVELLLKSLSDRS